ncbi:MAG: alanyl-tRNA editing protein [Clostridia bacterium]|nr:alanyl-tRNA editing protein [Clostridia bacterium]
MTERLYYDDPYLMEFEARVSACVPAEDGSSLVYLDQSAFYPTSGGQPFDTGTIGACSVTDVFVDENGDVAHRVNGSLIPGGTVYCTIDRDRRFDHMQQHAGEHILAGCVYKMFGGHTIGLHIGHEDSTIDAELPDGRMRLTDSELSALEDAVNAHIQANEEIRCYFPDAQELSRLPLRKPPAVVTHVRVVQIGTWEYCACGGTHPARTGEIGVFKLTDARPSRGKIRFTFVCGKRANRLFAEYMDSVKQAGALLSADVRTLPAAAEETIKRLKDAQYALGRLKSDMAAAQISSALTKAPRTGGMLIIKQLFDGTDAAALKDAAQTVTEYQNAAALLGSRTQDGVLMLFARSQDCTRDMGALISEAARRFGGKGGGRSEFARGSAPDERALDYAYERLAQLAEQGAR